MSENLTLTALAQYLGVSRPTAYKIVTEVGFPKPVLVKNANGVPVRRWSLVAVQTWKANANVG